MLINFIDHHLQIRKLMWIHSNSLTLLVLSPESSRQISMIAYLLCLLFTGKNSAPQGIQQGLTHLPLVLHICVGEPGSIGSGNGLAPNRWQAITWTSAEILMIEPIGTNFREVLIKILTFSFKKMHLKVSLTKQRPFRLGLNVLKHGLWTSNVEFFCLERVSWYYTRRHTIGCWDV